MYSVDNGRWGYTTSRPEVFIMMMNGYRVRRRACFRFYSDGLYGPSTLLTSTDVVADDNIKQEAFRIMH
jgi:hypothetical protein